VLFGHLSVQAKDFGTVGHTYEIKEQDLIEYIKSKLQKVDLEAPQEEMQEKVRSKVERPKAVPDITNAQEDKTWYFDPTYVLQEDLKDHEGKIIHKKGYKVNPLEKTRLSKALIFIDGDEELQVKYALKESLDKQVKIILTKGSPLELQKKHKVWIYFDQFGFLTTKLGIKRVPAIVNQEGLRLKIQELEAKKLAQRILSQKEKNKRKKSINQ
jgi:conjugal transfer pilus assembly protein TraW